ncbi:MAG TPA: tetratricopeptide repeat protein [Polyangia bacterium]
MNLLSVAPSIVLALFTVGAAPDVKAPVATGATPAEPPTVARMLERIDELHKRRDDRKACAEEQSLVKEALARAPQDYGVLWRAARFSFWLADDPGQSSDERSRVGKEGWDLAERAVTSNPNRVEGQYWAAVCMGDYALGLGVVKALAKGMEGKFRERLGRAEQLDRRYEQGAIDTAWGRFFDKLPWPKRDRDQAERHFKRALEVNPLSLRARVYLASTYLDEDRAAEAKRLLDEVAAAPAAGRYDPPEERRARAIGAGLMPRVAAKLK